MSRVDFNVITWVLIVPGAPSGRRLHPKGTRPGLKPCPEIVIITLNLSKAAADNPDKSDCHDWADVGWPLVSGCQNTCTRTSLEVWISRLPERPRAWPTEFPPVINSSLTQFWIPGLFHATKGFLLCCARLSEVEVMKLELRTGCTSVLFQGLQWVGGGRFHPVGDCMGTIVFVQRPGNIRHFIQSRISCYSTEGLHAWQDKGSGFLHAESP